MKLFCIVLILVFVVVLGVYYSVMFACAYKKFDEKMKKSQKKVLTIPGGCDTIQSERGREAECAPRQKPRKSRKTSPSKRKGE